MTTPYIAPYDELLSHRICLPVLPGGWVAGAEGLYVVVRGGLFRGRVFRPGEVLVCAGRGVESDTVVLVARGHGRPRLGTVVGAGMCGDFGEPCSPVRWQALGRVVAVLAPAAPGLGGGAIPGMVATLVPEGFQLVWSAPGPAAARIGGVAAVQVRGAASPQSRGAAARGPALVGPRAQVGAPRPSAGAPLRSERPRDPDAAPQLLLFSGAAARAA